MCGSDEDRGRKDARRRDVPERARIRAGGWRGVKKNARFAVIPGAPITLARQRWLEKPGGQPHKSVNAHGNTGANCHV